MFKKIIWAICLVPFTLHAGFASFQEVYDVVFNTTNVADDLYKSDLLPHYEVSSERFYQVGENLLKKAVLRTTNDDVDYYESFEKLLHANGVCFSGRWEITEDTPYSGYFKKGKTALLIGRASTALSETERGTPRAFAFAGKLFPTEDVKLKVQTENFFVLDVLAGADRDHYLGIEMTNKPLTGFRFSIIPLAFHILRAFNVVDADHDMLSVKRIASIAEEKSGVVAPKFIKLSSDPTNDINEEIDFRNELNISKHHPNCILFNVLANDVTDERDSMLWKKIGVVKLLESTVSYGCDRRLHFSHQL